MVSKSPCGLRTTSVVSSAFRFNLAEFHLGLGRCIGEPLSGVPGKPGDHVAVLTEGPEIALTSYLFSEIFSKFDDGQPNDLKDRVTWERFHEAERLCFETNQRLAVSGLRGPYEQELLLARNIAAKILGRFDWDDAAEGFGWGPGASTRLPRRSSDAAYKYSGHPETTAGNAALANAAICCIPSWKRELPDLGDQGSGMCYVVPGNRIVTVPKNYKTDRTIAIEPCMNMYVQKGLGSLMRKRLRQYGCNLDDQSRNQRLARVGSISGSLATVDLRMASDSISREIVNKLIRPDWLEALEQSRSQFGILPSGEKIFYQKFSSMGNGFTFELESLLFYSLALAWCYSRGAEMSRVSVYGDDIILPSTEAESFCGLLRFCGFTANEKKSYWSGSFRESCGKHFLSGHEITPFFVRKPIKGLNDLFLLHNNLYRWSERARPLIGEQAYACLRGLLSRVRGYAPAKWRKPRLFDGYGDGAFIGVFDEITPRQHPHGWEFWEIRVLAQVSEIKYTDVSGLLPKGLRNVTHRPRADILGFIPVSEPIEVHPTSGGRYREVKILVPQCATS